tara:strand:- start:12 stop:335 length:324 start_codon:yes stop_codon:yes gene_type:complete
VRTCRGSASGRPAAINWSKRSRRESGAMTTTMQRGSNVRPTMFSPGTTDRAHCSLRFMYVNAAFGMGNAQSGLVSSTKKLTSLRDVLRLLKLSSNWLRRIGQLRLEK